MSFCYVCPAFLHGKVGYRECHVVIIISLCYISDMDLTDDGHCFVCGPKNPIGLKLDFSFDGKMISADFTPKKEHQGYFNIVHGGIITTLLDEAMVKLVIAMGMPSVTAQMDVRLKKPLNVGVRITVTAEILKETRKTIEAYAKAVTSDGVVIADAKGKLVKVSN